MPAPDTKRYLFQLEGSPGSADDALAEHGVEVDSSYAAVPIGESRVVRGWAHPDKVPSLREAGIPVFSDPEIGLADVE